MTDKKFNAILAKNGIAREIRSYMDSANDSEDKSREPIFIQYIIRELKEIEKYLGEANQPSVEEIITSERTDI